MVNEVKDISGDEEGILDKDISSNMKLYRYMSLEEFAKLNAGLKLTRYKNDRHLKTTCKGFCFLGERTTFYVPSQDENGKDYFEEYKFSPENCINFLRGIVTPDVLVEFQPTRNIDIFKRDRNLC